MHTMYTGPIYVIYIYIVYIYSIYIKAYSRKVRVCMPFFRKVQKKGNQNVKKGQKRAKYFKIWTKMYKI